MSEPATTAAAEFVGSPAEYLAATWECLRGRDWVISDSGDGGMAVYMGDRSDQELIDDQAACRDELGVEPMANLSDGELRSRYEWRVEQYQCLVDAGFAIGDEMSFETFVDSYERTGVAYWDPIEPLAQDSAEVERANQTCPYSTTQW